MRPPQHQKQSLSSQTNCDQNKTPSSCTHQIYDIRAAFQIHRHSQHRHGCSFAISDAELCYIVRRVFAERKKTYLRPIQRSGELRSLSPSAINLIQSHPERTIFNSPNFPPRHYPIHPSLSKHIHNLVKACAHPFPIPYH